jgi:glycosyltransferase involved in cell wall biosynthesis
MHICFASLDYPTADSGGGVGSVTRTLAQALVGLGHQATVIAFQTGQRPERSIDRGVEIIWLTPGQAHWYLSRVPWLGPLCIGALRELERGWQIWRAVRGLHARRPVDIVEGIETGAVGLAWLFRGAPLVIRLHGEEYTFHKYTPDLRLSWRVRLTRGVQRLALRRARLLISPSRAHAREIAAELGGRCPPMRIVPNSVEDDGPAPDAEHSDPEPIVFYAGRLERRKGIPLLLEAMQQVIREVPAARLVLAGGSHPTLPSAQIDRLIVAFGLQGQVEQLQHVPAEALKTWYRRACVCVLPSYYETFGMAALEPMRLAKPVVVTEGGALPEVVEAEVSGLVVPAGDAAALAGAILRLLRDAGLRNTLGTAAQARARTCFNPDQTLRGTLAAYRTALDPAPHRRA